jgi:hypothetical protein
LAALLGEELNLPQETIKLILGTIPRVRTHRRLVESVLSSLDERGIECPTALRIKLQQLQRELAAEVFG